MSGLLVREMTLAGCERVAEIRVGGWQTAYRGIVPQSYLDMMSVPENTEHQRTRFLQTTPACWTLLRQSTRRCAAAGHGRMPEVRYVRELAG
ncbi:MAG: hypothetical protein HOY79_55280 [Streptomyces sp.]|nr:hypothetical protein [Streptomyces sp.]